MTARMPDARPPSPPLAAAGSALIRDGFAFARADEMRTALVEAGGRDWEGFAASWNDLGLDRYMADGGRYRRRRHAAFALAADGTITRKPHQPHYQSRDYNALNGGVERWFAPVTDAVGTHPMTLAVLRMAHDLFTPRTPPELRPSSWHAELHQFRIEAEPGGEGRPTPEGMHRDGVDWVLVMLIGRINVRSGLTTIHDLRRREIGHFTLAEPGDTALVDDFRVYHGVTAIHPLDPALPAHRDVLVLTLRRG